MAYQEQLNIIRQGVTPWNAWRNQHPETKVELSFANLSGVTLNGVNLSGASLFTATLVRIDLNCANLRGADLRMTDLRGADLRGADLTEAKLRGADLSRSNLSGANFNNARMEYTVFGDVDLRSVKGLETVQHGGPSTIGTDTLSRSEGEIPEIFLRGAGLNDRFIEYARSLTHHPIEYYTCFISYSNKDQEFAERIYADLQSHNVRCWYAPEDLKIGDEFRTYIDESIRLYDKLLLVLSQHSVMSSWVEAEVEAALEKERGYKKSVLFPIMLDDTVIRTAQAWAADISRTRHIGDFTRWKEHEAYQQGLKRLLRDLKA